MALSQITKIATGVDNTYAVVFALGYGQESDVKARVGDEVDGGGNPVYRNIDFSVPGLMTLDGALITAGTEVVFTRTESRTTLDVDWEDGANITDENLNAAQLQALRLIHEALDGRFEALTQDINMNGHSILNADRVEADTLAAEHLEVAGVNLDTVVEEVAAIAAEVAADAAEVETAVAEALAAVPNLNFTSVAALRAFAGVTSATVVYLTGWHADLKKGGGKFVLDATDTTSADDGGVIIVDAVGRRWKRVITDNLLTADMFGARVGVIADTALTNMWAAAEVFNCNAGLNPRDAFEITTTVTIPHGKTFMGRRGRLFSNSAIDLVTFAGAGKVWNLLLTGNGTAGNTLASVSYRGIVAQGILNGPGVAPTYKRDIEIRNCDIREIRGNAIDIHAVEEFLIIGNRIHDVGYSGIELTCSGSGRIRQNHISLIGPGISATAYGIAVTRTTGVGFVDDLVRSPRANRIDIDDNLIEDNHIWEGLDTHAGEWITFRNNTIRRCKLGIVATHDGMNAPSKCLIMGNHIVGRYLADNIASGNGITVVGHLTGPVKAFNIQVIGNYIEGHGNSNLSQATGAGIYSYSTVGLQIIGNTIKKCYHNGINLFTGAERFIIKNNTISDIGSNSATNPRAIWLSSTDAIGFIGGNVIIRRDGWGTGSLGTIGIEVTGSATNVITWEKNEVQASTVANRYILGAGIVHVGRPTKHFFSVAGTPTNTGVGFIDTVVNFVGVFSIIPTHITVMASSTTIGGKRVIIGAEGAPALTTTTIRLATCDGGVFASADAWTLNGYIEGF